MGVLNVTPDSFADGGRYFNVEAAASHALRMLEEGADIIDVGGESTRPGAHQTVDAGTELSRVLPVIEAIHAARPDAILSIDTYKTKVARAAVEAGAEIVNDVSALRWDPAMASAVAELRCGVVLMHTRGRPEEWRSLPPADDIVSLVTRELEQSACSALSAGIRRESMVLDPGFGFGKNFDENYPLLARFEEFHRLGFPLLAGTSKKSFIGKTVGAGENVAPEQRLFGTLATVTAAILKGAHIVRVHDVKPALDAARVADTILKYSS
jgi:dihydropteroate synthase